MHATDTFTQSGLKNSPDKAAALVQANCATLDCAFSYRPRTDTTNEIVDVVACKNVATLVPILLGLRKPARSRRWGAAR